jgi:hypothetical protein
MKIFKLLIMFFFLFSFIFTEEKEKTLEILKNHSPIIISTSETFNISSRLLASVIYADRRMNYNLLDNALDKSIAMKGRDNSIGIAQVKVSTANWIERQIHNPNSAYYLGEEFERLIPNFSSREETINNLSDSVLNLTYASAYISMIIKRWKNSGFDISDKIEIVATLYNLGSMKRNGAERLPHNNPSPNEYGIAALYFYESDLLISVFPRDND